jgi:hypothetical protein
MIADIDATEGTEGAARDRHIPMLPPTAKTPAAATCPGTNLIHFSCVKIFLNTEAIYIGYAAEISCFAKHQRGGSTLMAKKTGFSDSSLWITVIVLLAIAAWTYFKR